MDSEHFGKWELDVHLSIQHDFHALPSEENVKRFEYPKLEINSKGPTGPSKIIIISCSTPKFFTKNFPKF